MKHFYIKTCCTILLKLLLLITVAEGAPRVEFIDSAGEVELYGLAEITISIKNPDMANPFIDASVQGIFRSESGEPVKVDGFCDSDDGSVYRIRFMPCRPGRYQYEIRYSQPGVDIGHKGAFQAVAAGRKGLLQVDPDNRWHFIWEGTGEHYFWNGTTTYYLMGWDDQTIRRNIDRLHRLKINRLRVLLYGRNNPRPWGQPVVPTENFKLHLNPWPAKRPDDIRNPGFDLMRFNIEHWRKYERLLRHAREKDMIVSVIFFIGGQVLPTPFEANSEAEELFYKYTIARLAAFSNVTWDLGNEHNFHRKVPDWADTLGHRVKEWDPYDHLTSAHNVTYRTPKSTWLDMQLIQRWDSGQNAYMLGQRREQQQRGYIIPQVNEEYGYEDLWEKYPGQRSAQTRRKNAWEIYMAGCYQTTGESARRGTGVSPDSGGGWVNGRGDGTMRMLIGYGHILDFFMAFDWWNCTPLNESVDGPACCLGKEEKLYILYFRESGRATVRLGDIGYRGKWYNPRDGQWEGTCQAYGPVWTTPTTADKEDWVLWLEKDEELKDCVPPGVVSVVAGGNGKTVLVEFDEIPNESSAIDPTQYKIQPSIDVQKVSLGGRYGKTAILSVTPLQEKLSYKIEVSDVEDRAGNKMESAEVKFEYIHAGRPLVELIFDEGSGRAAKNTGAIHSIIQNAKLTPNCPVWSKNTPAGKKPYSLDFGDKADDYAVDLPKESTEVLGGLASFTITAWINCVNRDEGAGGNRIVHMADTLGTRAGFDLVFVRDGRLKIGINEWPDNTKAISSAGLIPVDEKARKDNWRFIVVSYDSTAKQNQVRFYIGSADRAAALDKEISYNQGPVRAGAGTLTIGHFSPAVRRGHTDRMFRGLIDDVRIFGSKTDGAGALPLEQIITIQEGSK